MKVEKNNLGAQETSGNEILIERIKKELEDDFDCKCTISDNRECLEVVHDWGFAPACSRAIIEFGRIFKVFRDHDFFIRVDNAIFEIKESGYQFYFNVTVFSETVNDVSEKNGFDRGD